MYLKPSSGSHDPPSSEPQKTLRKLFQQVGPTFCHNCLKKVADDNVPEAQRKYWEETDREEAERKKRQDGIKSKQEEEDEGNEDKKNEAWVVKEEGRFPLCFRCRTVSYCSKQCQHAHWKTHKVDCQISQRNEYLLSQKDKNLEKHFTLDKKTGKRVFRPGLETRGAPFTGVEMKFGAAEATKKFQNPGSSDRWWDRLTAIQIHELFQKFLSIHWNDFTDCNGMCWESWSRNPKPGTTSIFRTHGLCKNYVNRPGDISRYFRPESFWFGERDKMFFRMGQVGQYGKEQWEESYEKQWEGQQSTCEKEWLHSRGPGFTAPIGATPVFIEILGFGTLQVQMIVMDRRSGPPPWWDDFGIDGGIKGRRRETEWWEILKKRVELGIVHRPLDLNNILPGKLYPILETVYDETKKEIKNIGRGKDNKRGTKSKKPKKSNSLAGGGNPLKYAGEDDPNQPISERGMLL